MHNMKQLEAPFVTQLTPGVLKAAMKEAGASSGDLWKVPVGQLRVIEGFNVRVKNAKYKAHVRRLADSIKSEGFYQHEPFAGYVGSEGGENVIYIFGGHTGCWP